MYESNIIIIIAIISGRVVDSKTGQGIIGAIVSINNGASSAMTDPEGKYDVKADAGNITITISYLGYQTKNFQGITLKNKESYVQNGVEALEIAHKFVPRIILLDIMMPVMDGIEACKKLKQDEELNKTFILFLPSMPEQMTTYQSL